MINFCERGSLPCIVGSSNKLVNYNVEISRKGQMFRMREHSKGQN